MCNIGDYCAGTENFLFIEGQTDDLFLLKPSRAKERLSTEFICHQMEPRTTLPMEFSFSTIVVFCVIYFIETVLILLGNSFTIFVFWKHRAELKRTSYLLVNLAFADLLVALSISFFVGNGIRYLATNKISLDWVLITNLADVFCGVASMFSLLVISLERLYAVRWPFRHRTLNTRSYIYSLAFVWIIAGITFIFKLLRSLTFSVYLSMAYEITTALLIFLALVIICAAYILIHQETRQNIPEGLNERRAEQNKKLTNTLLVVTILSLICFLPQVFFSLVYVFTSASTDNNNLYHGLLIINVLQYANSIVNPIVYTFRIPVFKSEIQRCYSKLFRSNEIHDVNNSPESVKVAQQRTVEDIKLHYVDTKL